METHAWFDDYTKVWHVYTERKPDIRRFEEWFGPPSRPGRGGACAHWDSLPADALRIARRRKRTTAQTSKPATTTKIAAEITSTKPARCEIAWAGADSGEKMLGTSAESAFSAANAAPCWIRMNVTSQ